MVVLLTCCEQERSHVKPYSLMYVDTKHARFESLFIIIISISSSSSIITIIIIITVTITITITSYVFRLEGHAELRGRQVAVHRLKDLYLDLCNVNGR